MPRRASPYAGIAAVLAMVLVVGCVTGAPTARSTEVVVTVNATARAGTIATRLGTQFVWPGVLDRAAGTRERFDALAPPLVRINAVPFGDTPVLPAHSRQGDWNFEALNSIVSDIRRADAEVLLTAAAPPEWIWTCTGGPVSDPDFGDFADYMARLVAYYNTGAFVAESGRTITNPAGVANRIGHWELWNEPDMKGCPDGGNHLSPRQYVAMWNRTVPKMLAVDPTIKLIGPATANAVSKEFPDYIPALLAGATRKPDAISFHAYGGWDNTQSDRFHFDGEGSGAGLDGVERGLKRVKTLAPEIPIWITELNLNSGGWHDPADAHRSWTEFGAAWGASAFRRLVLAGVDVALQYQFAHPVLRQFSLVDVRTGEPFLPYWRDYYLARYFPAGSTVISSGSNLAGVDSLAVRPPDSNDVHILVVNRQIGEGSTSARGIPVTIRVDLRNFPDSPTVTALMIDSTTPLDTGPSPIALPSEGPVSLTFTGYGAAFLKIVASR